MAQYILPVPPIISTPGAIVTGGPTGSPVVLPGGTFDQVLKIGGSGLVEWGSVPVPAHTHPYLELTGGTVTGALEVNGALTKSGTAVSVVGHTHVKANITDFAHTHLKADVTDFTHTHLKADITDFAHTSASVTDFAEAVDDRVDALIVAGTGISKTYNDVANTLTLAATSSGPTILSLTTAPAPLSNPTADTAFGGTLSIPTSSLAVGKVIHVRAGGIYDAGAAAGSIRYVLRLNTTELVLSSGNMTANASAANRGWTLDVYLTVLTLGSPGTMEGQGFVIVAQTASTSQIADLEGTAVFNVTTTSNILVEISTLFTTSQAANNTRMRLLIVEVL